MTTQPWRSWWTAAWACAVAPMFLASCGGRTVVTDEGPPPSAGGAGRAGSPTAGAGGGGLAGAGGSATGCGQHEDGVDGDDDGFPSPADCDDTRSDVNPAAFDVPGNGVDDDCDGAVDNAPVPCDDAQDPIPLDTTDAAALGRAMGICPPDTLADANTRWRVHSISLWGLKEGWTKARNPLQHAAQPSLGSKLLPAQGKTMLMLSSGIARQHGQPGAPPGYPELPQNTSELLVNGRLDDDPICSAISKESPPLAWNPIALRVSFQVPSNATHLRWKARGVVVENLQTLVCNGWNGTFAAFREAWGGSEVPTNWAKLADSSPFSVDHLPFVYCDPTTFEEGGREYDFPCPAGTPGLPGPWLGGATEWMELEMPVVPSSYTEVTFILWGEGKGTPAAFSVLLDDFQWGASGAGFPGCE
jgi:hypothetical protein